MSKEELTTVDARIVQKCGEPGEDVATEPKFQLPSQVLIALRTDFATCTESPPGGHKTQEIVLLTSKNSHGAKLIGRPKGHDDWPSVVRPGELRLHSRINYDAALPVGDESRLQVTLFASNRRDIINICASHFRMRRLR